MYPAGIRQLAQGEEDCWVRYEGAAADAAYYFCAAC